MTHDEEMAARGRLVTDFSEIKKHHTTLLHETNRLGEIYAKVGSALKSLNYTSDDQTSKILKFDADCEAVINSPDKLWALVKDLEETSARARMLRAQVEQLGLR